MSRVSLSFWSGATIIWSLIEPLVPKTMVPCLDLLFFFKNYLFYMHECFLPTCMYVYRVYAWCSQRPVGGFRHLELELQTLMSCCVGAGGLFSSLLLEYTPGILLRVHSRLCWLLSVWMPESLVFLQRSFACNISNGIYSWLICHLLGPRSPLGKLCLFPLLCRTFLSFSGGLQVPLC